MKFELFNAILSMDSYHRGYDQGIELNSTAVGIANITTDSEALGFVDGSLERKDASIGFYAVAYDIGGIGKIISYRGTDYPTSGAVEGLR